MSRVIRLLTSPVRVRILQLTWEKECSAGDLAAQFDITFGAISQHLAILREAGALKLRKDGRSRLYSADRAALGPLAPALEAMWSDRLSILKTMAEQDQRSINRAKSAKPAPDAPSTKSLPRSPTRRSPR